MRSEAELSQGERWREALGLYALMTLLTVGVGFAQGSLAALAGYGALISALGFIYLPTELLARRGLSPLSFGIGAGSIPRSAKGALLIALLILPPYALSYHLWQRQQGHPAHVDLRALSRWGEELRGRPMTPIQRGELRLFAERDRLTFQWTLSPGESRVKLSLEGWSQAQVKARTRGIKVSPEPSSGRLIIEGGQRGTRSDPRAASSSPRAVGLSARGPRRDKARHLRAHRGPCHPRDRATAAAVDRADHALGARGRALLRGAERSRLHSQEGSGPRRPPRRPLSRSACV